MGIHVVTLALGLTIDHEPVKLLCMSIVYIRLNTELVNMSSSEKLSMQQPLWSSGCGQSQEHVTFFIIDSSIAQYTLYTNGDQSVRITFYNNNYA